MTTSLEKKLEHCLIEKGILESKQERIKDFVTKLELRLMRHNVHLEKIRKEAEQLTIETNELLNILAEIHAKKSETAR